MESSKFNAASLHLSACAIAIACAFGVGSAHAQSADARIGELERKLEQSLKLIDALNQRVHELEAKADTRKDAAPPKPASAVAAVPAAPAATDALNARVAEVEQQVAAMANRPEEDRGLEMHGFADAGVNAGSVGRPSGGYIGALDFYLTPHFTDRVKALFELNTEVGTDGTVGVDLERLQIGYVFSDALTLWVGRFHTPYGYWNTAFHHGAQLQTSILRPMFLAFEDNGGVLPAHTVGLWATGAVPMVGGRLHYDAYAGNSPRIAMDDPATAGTGTLDPNLAGSSNRSESVGGRVGFDFKGALEGLSLGGHAYSAKVGDDALSAHTTRVNFYGPWATYLDDGWEVLAEGYWFHNSDADGSNGSHDSRAGYAQAGYSIGSWTPYLRVESTTFDQADNYFAQLESGRSYHRSVVGLRYDVNPKTALKFEVNRTHVGDRGDASYSEFRSQLAIHF